MVLLTTSLTYGLNITKGVVLNTTDLNTSYVIYNDTVINNVTVTPTFVKIYNNTGNFVMSAYAYNESVSFYIVEFADLYKKFQFFANKTRINVTLGDFIPNESVQVRTDGQFLNVYKASPVGFAFFEYDHLNTLPGTVIVEGLQPYKEGVPCKFNLECAGLFCVHNFCRDSDTFCGDGFCDPGEFCGFDCRPPPKKEAAAGAGEGPVEAPVLQKAVVISDETISIEKIVLKSESNLDSVKVDVAVQSEATVSSFVIQALNKDSSTAYQYMEITLTNPQEITLKSSDTIFRVSLSWLKDNGFLSEDISLQRYNTVTASWEALSTEIVGQSQKWVTYQSTIPKFSLFAVTAQRNICGDNICGIREEAKCPQDCVKPEPKLEPEKPKPEQICGNSICEFGEELSCPADCVQKAPTEPACGNLICELGETQENCPSDCIKEKEIEPIPEPKPPVIKVKPFVGVETIFQIVGVIVVVLIVAVIFYLRKHKGLPKSAS